MEAFPGVGIICWKAMASFARLSTQRELQADPLKHFSAEANLMQGLHWDIDCVLFGPSDLFLAQGKLGLLVPLFSTQYGGMKLAEQVLTARRTLSHA